MHIGNSHHSVDQIVFTTSRKQNFDKARRKTTHSPITMSQCSPADVIEVAMSKATFVDCDQSSLITNHRFNAMLTQMNTVPFPDLDLFSVCIEAATRSHAAPPDPVTFRRMSDCYKILEIAALSLPMIKMNEEMIFQHMIASGIYFDKAFCQCADYVQIPDSGCETRIFQSVLDQSHDSCQEAKVLECEYLTTWGESCYNSILSTFETDQVNFVEDARQCQFVTLGECGVDLRPPVVVHMSDCSTVEQKMYYRFYESWQGSCSMLNDQTHYNETNGIFKVDAKGGNGIEGSDQDIPNIVYVLLIMGGLICCLVRQNKWVLERRRKKLPKMSIEMNKNIRGKPFSNVTNVELR